MSKRNGKSTVDKSNIKSTKESYTYGYVAVRFLDDSFCFFINAFVEIIEDSCWVYSKSCGHHKFPKGQVERVHGDSLLIWENNSLHIKDSSDDRDKDPG